MTPASLLADLRRRGLSARAEAGRLVVAPATLLTDDLRAAIRTHKAALLALLGCSVCGSPFDAEGCCPNKDCPGEGDGDPFELPPPGEGLPAAEYRAFWAAWDSWAGFVVPVAAGGP